MLEIIYCKRGDRSLDSFRVYVLGYFAYVVDTGEHSNEEYCCEIGLMNLGEIPKAVLKQNFSFPHFFVGLQKVL